MKMVLSIIISMAIASSSLAAEPTIISVGTDARTQPLVPRIAEPSSYGVTVYAHKSYDAEADPPFILEFAKQVPSEGAARAYAEFKSEPGQRVAEVCQAIPGAGDTYVLPQSRAERMRGNCIVYGYEPPKTPTWHDAFVPVVAKVKQVLKPKPKKQVAKRPVKKRRR